MNKNFLSIGAGLLLILITFGEALSGGGEARRLIFIGTADLQGQLDPVERTVKLNKDRTSTNVIGGISRIATTINTIKESAVAPVIVISSGDDLMGRYFHFFDGKAIIELMGKAGYEVFGLGNHEFDRGPGILGEALEKTDFTTLCSDLMLTGTALENNCKHSLIKEYDNIRVGFFSLMTEEFPFVSSGGNVRLQADNHTVAKNMIAILKAKGADLIVAVTHIGIAQDRQLAANIEGIDIIFGGHSHDYLLNYEKIGETLIVNGGEKGSALVYLDISLTPDNTIIHDSTQFSLIPITKEIAENKQVKSLLASYKARMPAAIILGKTETSWDLSKSSVRAGESNVANLVNDLIRNKFAVDVVLNNGGAFRGNKEYSPGPVTDTMLHAIDEFENDVYLIRIKGRYLQEILEHSASLFGSGGFLQVSGLRFTINMSGTGQIITEQNNTWSVTTMGERVTDISIVTPDGAYRALDPDKTYSIACNAYLAERSGDKYYWFKQFGQDQKNTYTTLYSILAEEFDKKKVLNPSKPDGRITILN